MKLFIDSADVGEIRRAVDAGLIDGVTTNPTLLSKSAGAEADPQEILKEITRIVPGDISAEVVATTMDDMLREGHELSKVADNIVIKVPLTQDGLLACRKLRADGIKVNVTLCFSANQALLAAKAKATYISPFVGRLDDVSSSGMLLVEQIMQVYQNYDFETQVLVASVRSPEHVLQAAMLGADVATVPGKILFQLFNHPLTDRGLEAFLADWNKLPKERRGI